MFLRTFIKNSYFATKLNSFVDDRLQQAAFTLEPLYNIFGVVLILDLISFGLEQKTVSRCSMLCIQNFGAQKLGSRTFSFQFNVLKN